MTDLTPRGRTLLNQLTNTELANYAGELEKKLRECGEENERLREALDEIRVSTRDGLTYKQSVKALETPESEASR